MATTQFIAGTSSQDHALSLKVFGGEILSELLGKAKLLQNIRSYTLKPGADSHQFPAFGAFGTAYHAVGTDLTGTTQTANQGERVIYADRPLISHTMIDNLQEVLMAAPMRQEYAANMGMELGEVIDNNVARVIHDGAAASATYSGGPTGYTATDAATALADITAADVIGWIHDFAQALDDNNVPEEDRFIALRPQQYRLLLDMSSTTNLWLSQDYRSTADTAEGKFPRYAGFNIVKSTNLPTDAFTGDTNRIDGTGGTKGNDYTADMSKNVCIGWHKSAAGAVRVADVAVESERMIEFQADLVVAKSILGVGLLRPECCGRLLLSAS